MSAVAALRDDLPFAVSPPRGRPVRRIRDDAEALAVAAEVAGRIAEGAVARDRDRLLPYEEMDLISDAGLLAITVPRAFGGPGVASGTVAAVIAALSAADGSIGQIPQNHFFILEALRLQGTEAQQRFFYERILEGERIGNALSEVGTRTAQDHATRLTRDGDGFRLNGRKFYSTGALFAHWIAVVANDEDERSTIALVPRDSAGLTIVDDWSGFGQRVTGSGTTILDDVPVHPFATISLRAVFDRPTSMGPFAQIMHAAVEQGIARAALAETVRFVTTRSRPWKDAGVERASDDPYTVAAVGELKIRLEAAQALLDRSGRYVDIARSAPSGETVAAASVAVAEAKIAATDAALLIASRLIELAGSQATLAEHGLDRFWRNARTHTVHDPVRWKYRAIGDYWLNGIDPPRHGAI